VSLGSGDEIAGEALGIRIAVLNITGNRRLKSIGVSEQINIF